MPVRAYLDRVSHTVLGARPAIPRAARLEGSLSSLLDRLATFRLDSHRSRSTSPSAPATGASACSPSVSASPSPSPSRAVNAVHATLCPSPHYLWSADTAPSELEGGFGILGATTPSRNDPCQAATKPSSLVSCGLHPRAADHTSSGTASCLVSSPTRQLVGASGRTSAHKSCSTHGTYAATAWDQQLRECSMPDSIGEAVSARTTGAKHSSSCGSGGGGLPLSTRGTFSEAYFSERGGSRGRRKVVLKASRSGTACQGGMVHARQLDRHTLSLMFLLCTNRSTAQQAALNALRLSVSAAFDRSGSLPPE
jgi:hypothetical protein